MKLRLVAAMGLSAALLLTACSDNGTEATPEETAVEETSEEATGEETAGDETSEEATGEETAGEETGGEAAGELSGTLTGIGASSMGAAQTAWMSAFMDANPGVEVSYAAEGSGAGVTGITNGGAMFAGSDAPIVLEDNVAGNFASCSPDSIVYNIPVYISPVAMIFNIEGIESLNLTPEVSAQIFKGDIAKWNDPAIAELNEGVELPDEFITVVHRSDSSGTTENFTDYLSSVAPDVWDAEPTKDWPYGGQGAEKTDGVKNAVEAGQFSIGYVDASAAEGLSVIHLGSDGNFAEPTPEAAAAVVENSPIEEGREEHDLAISLDREAEGYPIVLVAYGIACASYEDANTAELVKGYLSYITSEEGQELSSQQTGAAPLSEGLREQVTASIEAINS